MGTPLFLTDEVGSIVWRREQTPFGITTFERGTSKEELRFPGQYHDPETGLNQNWHRDYAPMLGRYVEPDPVGIEKAKNHLFVYVNNMPNMLIDPKGLGCGSGAVQDLLIPDSYGEYCFEDACNKHDDCYGCAGKKAGKSKEDCDYEFYQDMLAECNKVKGGTETEENCRRMAYLYYQAVDIFGQGAFNDARKCCE